MHKLFINLLLSLLSGSVPAALAATSIPLELNSEQWQILEYSRIPANRLSQLEQGIQIDIRSSASPLIYVFDQPQTIQSISAMGKINRLPEIPAGHQQGDPGADDFPFRLGLVIEGDKRLNFAQRLVASKWILTLFELAPENTGIEQIRFLNLSNPQPIDWNQRQHPDSKGLFTERIVGQARSNAAFNLQHTLDMPTKVLALWISADGDDTGSSYSLTLNSVSFN